MALRKGVVLRFWLELCLEEGTYVRFSTCGNKFPWQKERGRMWKGGFLIDLFRCGAKRDGGMGGTSEPSVVKYQK